MTRQTAKQKIQVDLTFYKKLENETKNRLWRKNQCAGRHQAMFFVSKSDMILTILLSTRFVSKLCVHQSRSLSPAVLASLSFFCVFVIIFDIYVIICLFKMSTRFFMISVLRVNCTTNTNSSLTITERELRLQKKLNEKQIRKKR